MALYESRGRISEMSEVKSGQSQSGFVWERMTLTLEIPGFQGSVYYQVFQVSNEKVKEVLLYNIGDKVEISWSMYAREWNGKMYNNVDLIKIAPQDATQKKEYSQKADAVQEKPAPAPAAPESDDPNADLPF